MDYRRNDIKQALKDVLLTVPNVKAVHMNSPRQQNLFPAIAIVLEKVNEKVVTMGNPSRRHIRYHVSLYIQTIDPNPDEQASQNEFDDFLDEIDTVLRANKTLNDRVLSSAWETIDTDGFEPQVSGSGGALVLRAVKTFTVLVEIVG